MKFESVVILTVLVVLGFGYWKIIRPKLRDHRYRSWEKAGLLPHQVDPYAPRPDDAAEPDGDDRG